MTCHSLKISSTGIELIKKTQGLSLEKYRDENGIWVIGYGHVISQGDSFNKLITPAEAAYLLQKDLQKCEDLLRKNITQPLTQDQHDALVSLIFSLSDTSGLQMNILQTVCRV
ncbi:lysozyme [Enterobacter sp. RHBSTW-00994]|uniref:lysozyme n=1 Tax=Enterobacteriaceae TaxID=543 RepID=UPI0015EABB5D|nr:MULTISPECIES: lysozyme [Enterobacteriaceae]MBM3071873.1 glycoside hydrolase family protein [Lelliottia sp. RWM.1]QLR45157.1 lysozyme [Enterobacter sp. RHBSTW-00994]